MGWNMKRIFAVVFAITFVSVIANADVPTTNPTAVPAPTTRPMHAKKPVPKDWVKFENGKGHFVYFVPRTWKAGRKSDEQTDFDFANHTRMEIAQVTVMAFTGCHQADVEELAKVTKEEEPKQQPTAKWIHDEMTDMGGRPAWMYVTEKPQQGIEIWNGVQRKIEIKMRTVIWTAIVGKDYYQVMLDSDGPNYARNMAFAQRVVDSMKWTDDAGTTQPAK
jgi:hypothetical protein